MLYFMDDYKADCFKKMRPDKLNYTIDILHKGYTIFAHASHSCI